PYLSVVFAPNRRPPVPLGGCIASVIETLARCERGVSAPYGGLLSPGAIAEANGAVTRPRWRLVSIWWQLRQLLLEALLGGVLPFVRCPGGSHQLVTKLNAANEGALTFATDVTRPGPCVCIGSNERSSPNVADHCHAYRGRWRPGRQAWRGTERNLH